MAWSPDGHRLATIGDPNGAIMIWDASAGYQLAASPEFLAAIHSDRAIRSWYNGDFEAALAEFEEVIRIDPNSAKAYDRRAKLYLKKGELDKAIADYGELIRLDPKAPSNYQARACILLDKGEFDRAAADLSNAIALSPSSELDSWLMLAAARLAAGQPKEYRKTCAEMLERFRQTESAWVAYIVAYACTFAPDAVDDWPVPVALAEMAARSEPTEAYSLFALGAVLYRSGRAFEAIRYLSQAELIEQAQIGDDGRAPVQTWLYLAMAHHRLGNGVEAHRYFEKAAPLIDREDIGVWVLPGLTSRVALKLLADEAGTLLKIDPAHLPQTTAYRADTCYMRARHHAETGDLTQALAAYDEAIQLDAGRAEYFLNRGKAHAGKGNLDRALADFTETIRLDPSAAEARLERGCTHVEKGDLPKADVDFQEALRGNSLRWQDYFTLAASQRIAKHPERVMPEDQKAAYLFQQLLRLKAKTDPTWLCWVSCCLADLTRRGRLPDAVFVSDMPWVSSTYGPSVPFPQRDSWCSGLNGPLFVAGFPYPKCVVTDAFEDGRPAEIVLDISAQKFRAFNAQVGVSDSFAYIGPVVDPSDRGSVRFQVLVDGEVKHETETLQYGAICPISVAVAGAKEVRLRVLHEGDGAKNHLAGWGFARFIQAGADDPLEEPPAQLQRTTDATRAIFLSQVHCRLEHKDLARRWYDKAVEWLDKNPTDAEKLRVFREEAAELLGISDKPLTEKEKPK
ncbi:MAG: tetratricopeptide repeat protein [Thermoguttaceae bacterium]